MDVVCFQTINVNIMIEYISPCWNIRKQVFIFKNQHFQFISYFEFDPDVIVCFQAPLKCQNSEVLSYLNSAKKPYNARFIANSSSCTTTELSKMLTSCLTTIKNTLLNIVKKSMKGPVKICFGQSKIHVRY